MKPTHHLDYSTLLAYAAGTLDEAFSVVAASHLAVCPTCRNAVREAEAMGLANSCVADDLFDSAIHALVAEIAANSPFSHAANKRLLTQTDGLPIGAGLAHEIYKGEGVGPDMRDRIAAFAARSKKG